MKIERLSIPQIIDRIENEIPLHAVSDDYAFSLKIESYTYYVCAAIHNGHQFRKDLWDNCLHTEYDRWYEEDPETKQMIQSHPIVIAGIDSRFEYDLNRDPDQAVFDTAWGKQLWKVPLSASEKQKSLNKHQNFYKVVQVLMHTLEQKHQKCIVYDMHSYNWKRWDRAVPTWNLGTSNIDHTRFGNFVNSWRDSLAAIKLPHNQDSKQTGLRREG